MRHLSAFAAVLIAISQPSLADEAPFLPSPKPGNFEIMRNFAFAVSKSVFGIEDSSRTPARDPNARALDKRVCEVTRYGIHLGSVYTKRVTDNLDPSEAFIDGSIAPPNDVWINRAENHDLSIASLRPIQIGKINARIQEGPSRLSFTSQKAPGDPAKAVVTIRDSVEQGQIDRYNPTVKLTLAGELCPLLFEKGILTESGKIALLEIEAKADHAPIAEGLKQVPIARAGTSSGPEDSLPRLLAKQASAEDGAVTRDEGLGSLAPRALPGDQPI